MIQKAYAFGQFWILETPVADEFDIKSSIGMDHVHLAWETKDPKLRWKISVRAARWRLRDFWVKDGGLIFEFCLRP